MKQNQKYKYTTNNGFTFIFKVIKNEDNSDKVIILTEDPINLYTITKKELKKATKI